MLSDTFQRDPTSFHKQGMNTSFITHLPAQDLFLEGTNLVDEK